MSRENTFVSSQELVNEICDEKRFRKIVGGPLKEIRAFAGDGLFTAQTFPPDQAEPNWGKAHRILMPAFGPQSIQSMLPNMLDIGLIPVRSD
jgi:cytochrome P450/NADPH-cytochrome P450 reductase